MSLVNQIMEIKKIKKIKNSCYESIVKNGTKQILNFFPRIFKQHYKILKQSYLVKNEGQGEKLSLNFFCIFYQYFFSSHSLSIQSLHYQFNKTLVKQRYSASVAQINYVCVLCLDFSQYIVNLRIFIATSVTKKKKKIN